MKKPHVKLRRCSRNAAATATDAGKTHPRSVPSRMASAIKDSSLAAAAVGHAVHVRPAPGRRNGSKFCRSSRVPMVLKKILNRRSGAAEVYETALDVRMDEFHANVVAHVESFKAEREPAFGRRLEKPNPSALVRCASDDGVELLSNLSRQQQRGGGLDDPAFNFGGGVFLIGAVLGQLRQLRNGVGQRCACQRGFQQSLRDQIREAPVRRGGMRVVLYRQREMSGGIAAGEIKRVFAAAR